ncbi:hypothetical protein AKJ18_04685 [Vibrio xuii]|nr:hypothetical protein AKJ18_04685 [Vibrio xuii]
MLAIVGFGNHVRKNILPALERINISIKFIVVRDTSRYFPEEVDKYKLIDSLDLILNDPSITHIYIATPNSTHVDISKRALRANKNVLCEKPVSRFSHDVEDIIHLAKKMDRKFSEMSMFMHHKQYDFISKTVFSSKYSQIKRARFVFRIPHLDKNNVRYSALLHGGAILDLGFYPLSAVVSLFPESDFKSADVFTEEGYEVDTHGRAMFKKGTVEIICEWGFGFDYENFIEFELIDGVLKAERAFTKPADYESIVEVIRTDGSYDKIETGQDDHFANVFNDFLYNDEKNYNNIIKRARLIEEIYNINVG